MASPQAAVHPEQAPRPTSFNGIAIREDTIYTNHKGEESKGIRERAEKALEKLAEPLRRLLQRDETILYLAHCQAPVSILEQLSMGWYIKRATSSVVVLTNRRLLHFLVKSNSEWKKVLRSLSWGSVEHARVKGWLHPALELKYRKGKKESYWNLRRDDARKIKILLPAILSAGALESAAGQAPLPLCPECLSPLSPRVYKCSRCGQAFKDEATLIRRSLLIPGGGYFYIGHWLLGVGDFVAEVVLLAAFVSFLVVGLVGPKGLLGSAVYVALLLAVEKWMTIYHCRRFVREFIPQES